MPPPSHNDSDDDAVSILTIQPAYAQTQSRAVSVSIMTSNLIKGTSQPAAMADS